MATPAQWIAGARPRTLPAAVAPVAAGTGVAVDADGFVAWKALLALVVALALQVGVNYANDYSDGVRGTDDDRVGPLRLTGSRAATPGAVRAAAFAAFGAAAVAGLVLVLTTAWWLVLVGAASIAAGWFYTGGSRPYGYSGLGEVMVFVFFGLVAVVGTAYVQVGTLAHGLLLPALEAAVAVGAVACAILVVNNLRDIPTDRGAGKLTLAVRLGDDRTRGLFALLLALPAVMVVGLVLDAGVLALLGMAYVVAALPAVRSCWAGRPGATWCRCWPAPAWPSCCSASACWSASRSRYLSVPQGVDLSRGPPWSATAPAPRRHGRRARTRRGRSRPAAARAAARTRPRRARPRARSRAAS